MRPRLRLCLLLLFLTSAVWAGPGLEIKTNLEQPSDPLPFGKPATLVLTVSWDEKWSYSPPEADSLSLEGFTVIDSFRTDAPLAPGRRGVTYNIVFTRFEPGQATIPAVAFETPAGVFRSQSLSIDYKGAQPKEEGDQPDGPKETVELSTRDFWIWLAKVVGIALLVLLLLAALVRRLGVLERWLSPRARALRQLDRLAKRLDKGVTPADQAMLEMVEVVRLYLARAYKLVTREATSSEISAQMTLTNPCQNIKPVARAVLEHGDGAKFARRQPGQRETRDLLEQLKAALRAEKRKPL
jgi:heme exporter protein D